VCKQKLKDENAAKGKERRDEEKENRYIVKITAYSSLHAYE